MPGLLTHTPARVVAQALIDLGYGVAPDPRAPAAWSVYYGLEPDQPDEVITVRLTTGLSEGTTQFDGIDQERYGILIRTRSMDEDSGWAKANAIQVGLHSQNILGVTVAGVAYVISSLESRGGVNSLTKGDPSSSRSIHTANLLAVIDQA